MIASKDICSVCVQASFRKLKFLRCSGPCSAKFQLSYLQVSDRIYTLYTVNGESTYKCGVSVKQLRSLRDQNTPVRSLRSVSTSEIGKKIVSHHGELIFLH
jgi:hypothetical protein